jgi:apolipoprotein N-acyltransferase
MKSEKVNTVLEWSATTVIVAAAIATALAFDPINIFLFNLGSVMWLIWAVRVKRTSMIVLNIIMILVYVYGSIIRMT